MGAIEHPLLSIETTNQTQHPGRCWSTTYKRKGSSMFFDESPKDSKKFIGEMKTIKRSIRHVINNYYNGELNIDLPHTPDNLQKVDIYEKVLEDFCGIMDNLEYLELPTKEIGKLTFDEKSNSWYCGESKIKENQSFEVLLKPAMDQNPYWVQTALKYNSE